MRSSSMDAGIKTFTIDTKENLLQKLKSLILIKNKRMKTHSHREDIKANPPLIIIEIYDQDKVKFVIHPSVTKTRSHKQF